MDNQWEQKTRESLLQEGGYDSYELSTSLLIQDKKKINDEVLPIIINTIEKENNQSGRTLQLWLSKSTIIQPGIKFMMVAARPLPGHSCPNSPSSIYVDVVVCR